MTEKFHLSWEDFHQHCRQLAQQIKNSSQSYHQIVAVSRGGLLPAGILSYELNIRNCQTVNMASYDGVGERREDEKIELRATLEGVDEHTLIVDDISDSGRTFKLLRRMYPQAAFVSVYAKAAGVSSVDIYAQMIPDCWLVFPWD